MTQKGVVLLVRLLFVAMFFPSARLSAQIVQPPPGFQYTFAASSPDGCGLGGIHMYGFEQNEPNWAFYGPYVNISGPYDYLIYSWTLRDEQGVIASGSYNSQTGASTGGTGSSGANFEVSRYPVGDLIFTATGSLHASGAYGPCVEGINADADMLSNSFWLIVNPNYTYQFTSKASGLVIQIPGASSADYTQVTQDTNTSAAQQKWTLPAFGANGYYRITNKSTGKPLFNDTSSQHTSVVQLSGSSTAW